VHFPLKACNHFVQECRGRVPLRSVRLVIRVCKTTHALHLCALLMCAQAQLASAIAPINEISWLHSLHASSTRISFSLRMRYVFPGSSSLKTCKKHVIRINKKMEKNRAKCHKNPTYFCFSQRLHGISPFCINPSNNSKQPDERNMRARSR
jgi:hypothetical protein